MYFIVENIYDDTINNTIDNIINKNAIVENVFDKVPNNGPKIISNVPFSTSILILPAKKKEETSLNGR